MVPEALAPDDPVALRSGIEQTIALRRYGTNDEVAHLIAFLASDASSYCNGAIYLIRSRSTSGMAAKVSHIMIQKSSI